MYEERIGKYNFAFSHDLDSCSGSSCCHDKHIINGNIARSYNVVKRKFLFDIFFTSLDADDDYLTNGYKDPFGFDSSISIEV